MARVYVRANQAIRKNDMVRVISGRESHAGKTGRVLSVIPKKNQVIIEKVNMVKRHQKPNATNRQGGIIEKEAPLHLSNVMLVERGSTGGSPKEEKKVEKATPKKRPRARSKRGE